MASCKVILFQITGATLAGGPSRHPLVSVGIQPHLPTAQVVVNHLNHKAIICINISKNTQHHINYANSCFIQSTITVLVVP